jgi:NAD(P)-dependent dehydrogenase (short-subunit alcohol dehydrogenase family)
MDLHLQDKIAIVTGGYRGLGRAVSLGLASEGAKVAVNYRTSQADAEQVVAEINASPSGSANRIAMFKRLRAAAADDARPDPLPRDMFTPIQQGGADTVEHNIRLLFANDRY